MTIFGFVNAKKFNPASYRCHHRICNLVFTMSSGNEELSPLLAPMGLPPVSGMATDLNKGKRSGPKKKNVKSPEMIDNSDEEATNVVSKDVDMADSTQMGVHTTAIAAQRAIFSLNRINLRTPPLEVKFGEWNDRPLKMNRAKDLLATMKSQELRPFLLHNMLPLIIPRSDVESSCLSLDFQQVSTSPMLKLTATGLAKKVLRFAGGQHRFHAVKLAVDETKILIQKTREQIDKERERTLKTDQARAKRDEAIVEMSALIKEKEAFMDSISTWGVILYDEGKDLYIHFNYWGTTIFYRDDGGAWE